MGWKTCLCPLATALGRHDAHSRTSLGDLVDAPELLFELRRVQLLAVNIVHDFEKLVFSNDDYVRVFLVRVLDGVASGSCRYPASVEHPPVARHGHWLATHVLWLE